MLKAILKAAMKGSHKAATNFGLKLGSTMAGSVGSVLLVREVHKFDKPLSEQDLKTKKGMKKAVKRAARDSAISAGCSITASVAYNVASNAIGCK